MIGSVANSILIMFFVNRITPITQPETGNFDPLVCLALNADR